jgi:tape measure domain-containing protein
MASNQYDIVVNTFDAQRNINALYSSIGRLDRTTLGLGNAFKGLVTAASLTGLASLSDTVTSINNKLRVTAKDQEDVNKQFNALAAIATSTRTPLEGIASVYGKMMMVSDTLGINQKQAAEYTTTLAQAIKLTGSTTAETNSVLLQFSQGLSAGRFQGDELRAILEGNITIVQALAKEMGKSTQEIKKMGSEGKITAQVMLSALAHSADEIATKFAKMTPTISEAMTVLGIQSKVAFNEFEKNTQVGQNTAKAIESIAYSLSEMTKYIDMVIGPLKVLISVIAALAAFTIVGKILSGIVLILEGMSTVIFGAGAAWTALRTSIGAASTQLERLSLSAEFAKKIIIPLFSTLGALAAGFGFNDLGNWFKSFSDPASDASKELEDFRKKQAKASIEGLDATKKIATAKEAESDAHKKVTEEISKETAALSKLVAAYKDATEASMVKYQVDTDAITLSERQKLALEMTTEAFASYKSKIDELNAP